MARVLIRQLDGRVVVIAELAPTLFRELVPSALLLREARRWCRQLDHPSYDCLDLALAAQRSAVLITRDQRFVRKVAGVPEAAALVRLLESDDNGSDRSSAHKKRPSHGPGRLRLVAPSP